MHALVPHRLRVRRRGEEGGKKSGQEYPCCSHVPPPQNGWCPSRADRTRGALGRCELGELVGSRGVAEALGEELEETRFRKTLERGLNLLADASTDLKEGDELRVGMVLFRFEEA